MVKEILKKDRYRYAHGKVPLFQIYYRKFCYSKGAAKIVNGVIYKLLAKFHHIEIPGACTIGEGLYIGHPYGITLNPKVVIGKNCNIHKGVTIGQENRGQRKGVPVIGDSVWIGINSTIVGKVTVGDDVLIAPNTYVNCDIPSHSVVFGNPCTIKQRDNATEDYVNRKV